MSDALHPSPEVLGACVDGALAARESAEVEAHARTCETCAGELRALAALKTQLRDGTGVGADPAFDARIRAALDREDGRALPRRVRPRWPYAALAAAAAALLLWAALPRAVDLPAEAAVLAREAAAQPSARTPAAALEARFAAAELPFAARVLDLGMMGWEIASGEVSRLAERPSTQILYRDATGRSLLCVMLEARASELPDDAARFDSGAITFFEFTRGDVTVVAWAEGDVLCFLAGRLPAEEVRALAVAKAMLPPPS
ncbi:MAG: zf-HC2 domain-containing protein [Deltaproteobacteria bacterium]|nr:zf-HC2 domain-containing protein [Deltaproteobacteria bacterium]